MIADAIVAWRESPRSELTAVVKQRRLGDTIDLDAVADHVFVTFEGAFILARAMRDGGHMRAQLRLLRQMVDLVLRADRPSAGRWRVRHAPVAG
jgi:TetR/AcrR family transcriptional repressor of nem operon